jgi:hypothetical protein
MGRGLFRSGWRDSTISVFGQQHPENELLDRWVGNQFTGMVVAELNNGNQDSR